MFFLYSFRAVDIGWATGAESGVQKSPTNSPEWFTHWAIFKQLQLHFKSGGLVLQ